MTVAYTFATRTSSIPLSELDANFATTTTLGNVSFQLGNVVTTVGNLTLTNVTISSGTATLGNVTYGNVTYTGTLTGGTGVVNIGSGQIYKDASGNVGFGMTAPAEQVTVGTANDRVGLYQSGTTTQLRLGSSVAGTAMMVLQYDRTTGTYQFSEGTNGNTGNPDIFVSANGNVLFGATSDWTGGFEKVFSYSNTVTGRTISAYNNNNSAGSAFLARVDFTATRLVEFFYGVSTSVGTITTNGTGTSYNSASDRRLKVNIKPANDAGSIIDNISIVQHDWKSGGKTRYGVIAQDLNSVFPEAVNAGDDDTIPKQTWGVDYSKLVPVLVKEIQTLRARVKALEAK